MLQAQHSARWLHQIAEVYHLPIATMARQLRSTKSLAREVGRLIAELARKEAMRLVEQDARAPVGDELYERLVQGFYAPLWEAKKRKAKQATRAGLEAEVRQEKKLKQAQAREAQPRVGSRSRKEPRP